MAMDSDSSPVPFVDYDASHRETDGALHSPNGTAINYLHNHRIKYGNQSSYMPTTSIAMALSRSVDAVMAGFAARFRRDPPGDSSGSLVNRRIQLFSSTDFKSPSQVGSILGLGRQRVVIDASGANRWVPPSPATIPVLSGMRPTGDPSTSWNGLSTTYRLPSACVARTVDIVADGGLVPTCTLGPGVGP